MKENPFACRRSGCGAARRPSHSAGLGRAVVVAILFGLSVAGFASAGSIFDDDWTPPPSHNTSRPPTDVPPATAPPRTTPPEPQAHDPAIDPTPARQPFPGKAEQAKTRVLMKEAYAKGLADHTPLGRQNLARTLLADASNRASSAASTDQFVLLCGAVDAAREAGDWALCFRAADTMGTLFDVDAIALKAEAAIKMRPHPTTPVQAVQNVRAGLVLLGQLEAREDWLGAARVGAALQPASANDPALRAALQKAVRALDEMRSFQARLAPALEKLKSAPGDPAANVAVGKYLCFIIGQWERGLPMLAKGSDVQLALVATKDLASPHDAQGQTDIGDDWWKIADALTGTTKAGVQRRAAFWYRQALPALAGLRATVAQKRINEAAAAGGAPPPQALISRFCHDASPSLYALDDQKMPDELTAVQEGEEVRIEGTGKSDSKNIDGKLVGHFGKAFLITGRAGSGTLEVGSSSYESDHTSYYLLLREKDGTLRQSSCAPSQGTVYTWSASERNGKIVLEIRAGEAVFKSIAASADRCSAFGFAASVRHRGDKAKLSVHILAVDAAE